MNRIQFFNQLEYELSKNGLKEIDDVLRDYEEIFIEGMKKGKSEEQIVDELETPQEIAKNYKSKSVNVKQSKKDINSKIKLSEFMRIVMVGLLVWFVIDIIRFGSIMPGWMIFAYIVICVSAISLICVYTKNLGKLKSKENELNNIAKKDLEDENE